MCHTALGLSGVKNRECVQIIKIGVTKIFSLEFLMTVNDKQCSNYPVP